MISAPLTARSPAPLRTQPALIRAHKRSDDVSCNRFAPSPSSPAMLPFPHPVFKLALLRRQRRPIEARHSTWEYAALPDVISHKPSSRRRAHSHLLIKGYVSRAQHPRRIKHAPIVSFSPWLLRWPWQAPHLPVAKARPRRLHRPVLAVQVAITGSSRTPVRVRPTERRQRPPMG